MIAQATNDHPRVLVCDDDRQTRRALRVVLHEAGYQVDTTSTAEEAIARAALRPPDVAIVELVLHDADGVALCRRLRESTAMPVIVLSALHDGDETVRALEAGADDYMTKPFAPRELVASLGAILRRVARADGEPRIEIRGLEIDLLARTVRRDGEKIHLTPIESGSCARWSAGAGGCSPITGCCCRCGARPTWTTRRPSAPTLPTSAVRSSPPTGRD